ncbi:MAG TPA: hypothetical protein VFR73_22465, partial [Hyphomicrobiaceae bacterium]|nr:hypothetical protein [Hyphomicrobiaceae bacterium]
MGCIEDSKEIIDTCCPRTVLANPALRCLTHPPPPRILRQQPLDTAQNRCLVIPGNHAPGLPFH